MSPLAPYSPILLRDAPANATNATAAALQVACAFPVSGQYGPGSRILYYILVVACVVGREAVWLRNAVLAAALLFPAVAAIHAIVLAAVHVDGAIDMDVYGAFQLCSIGLLAAPVTAKLSSTYFNSPGRNIVFLWTGLVLAGLLSLTVEFYRAGTFPCYTISGNASDVPVSTNYGSFPYTENPTCGLTCNITAGPFSPLRSGSVNNIYVIPAPKPFDFGTATLLAAACCIPAILNMVGMWNKVLKESWKSRFGQENADELITGSNGATVGQMRTINDRIRQFLSVVEVPMFGCFVMAILVLGEINFWSKPVQWQTEPIQTIGQWAPIAGTVLAIIGSLYLPAANHVETQRSRPVSPVGDVESMPRTSNGRRSAHSRPRSARSDEKRAATLPARPAATHHVSTAPLRKDSDLYPSVTHATTPSSPGEVPSAGDDEVSLGDPGGRRKVAKFITDVSTYFGTASRDVFDDSGFRRGRAVDFPEIPGEDLRNEKLPEIREIYNPQRDRDGNATPYLSPRRSFTGSQASGLGILMPQDPGPSSPARVRTSTLPSGGERGAELVPRRSTLDVPPVNGSIRRAASVGTTPMTRLPVMEPWGARSPAIVVSPDPDTGEFEVRRSRDNGELARKNGRGDGS